METSGEILILAGDEKQLRNMYEALKNDGYSICLARTMVEAFERINVSTPRLVVINRDLYKTDPQKIYNHLKDIIRSKGIQSMVMGDSVFTDEFLGKVRDALK